MTTTETLSAIMSGESRKDMTGQCEDRSLTPSSLTARDIPSRPPINYSSFGAFWKSVGKRWKSIWTKHFILALLAGQLLSLCITCTNVTTTELVNRGWTLSTTQGFFLWVLFISNLIQAENPLSFRYFTLFLIYTPYTIYQCKLFFYDVSHWHTFSPPDGFKGWGKVILYDGWRCTSV